MAEMRVISEMPMMKNGRTTPSSVIIVAMEIRRRVALISIKKHVAFAPPSWKATNSVAKRTSALRISAQTRKPPPAQICGMLKTQVVAHTA